MFASINERKPRFNELKELREYRLQLPAKYGGVGYIDLRDPIDWSLYNSEHPTLQWWLNGFRWLRPLLAHDQRTKDDVELAAKLLLGWSHQNLGPNPRSKFAWDGHAAAYRSEQLAALWAQEQRSPTIENCIRTHIGFLSLDDNYQGHWNHGLDQSIALITLGISFGDPNAVQIGQSRTTAALEEMIDEDGVTNEQAVRYQEYSYQRIGAALQALDSLGIEAATHIIERHARMPDFLAHAIQPDGTFCRLGDTTSPQPTPMPGTLAEYTVTGGRTGICPSQRTAIYKAGYVFGRSGWGVNRPFREESHYSIRFGPGRRIHGHNDHMSITYMHRGQRVIVDGGFHGYSKDVWRDHLRTLEAHNVTLSRDAGPFQWGSPTTLDGKRVEEDWQTYAFSDRPYKEHVRTRKLLFGMCPFEFIVVVDEIRGGKEATCEQVWHFDSDFSCQIEGSSVFGRSNGLSFSLFQLWPHDRIVAVSGQNEPPLGWVAHDLEKLEPSPSVVTFRRGRKVTFLTVIAMGAAGQKFSTSQRRTNEGRIIEVCDGVRTASAFYSLEGELSLRHWRAGDPS